MGDATLVEMVVVRVSPYLREDRPLLWLGEKEAESPRLLPIAIGEFEAAAIQMPLEGEDPIRPISYDLLSTTLERLEVTVDHVVIESVRKSIFFARVVVEREAQARSIDSRPSDAVALALRTGAPIYATASLLDEVGVGPLDASGDLERGLDQFHELEPQIIGEPDGDERVETPPPPAAPAAPASPEVASLAPPEPGWDELTQLQYRLQRAVVCEEYEEAARLRDEIESRDGTVGK
jgi:uncharacterized protein